MAKQPKRSRGKGNGTPRPLGPRPGGPAKKHGGQTRYTEALAAEICERLAEGETLPDICKDDHMPSRVTVMDWANADREGFADRYAQARMKQRDAWADDIMAISDDGKNDWMEKQISRDETIMVVNKEAIERSKLRVETRKWLLKCGSPQKYGDKIQQTISGDAAFLEMLKHVSKGG